MISPCQSFIEVSVCSCACAGSVLKEGPPAARCCIAEDDASSGDDVVPLGTGKVPVYTDNI